jgi:hypothetical protein
MLSTKQVILSCYASDLIARKLLLRKIKTFNF